MTGFNFKYNSNMKRIKKTGIILLGLTLIFISGHIYYLSTFNATESYPEDQFLSDVQHKKALVVVAHDDDICAGSGTIAKLTAAGWDIQEVCFQDSNPLRVKHSHITANIIMNQDISFLNAPNEEFRTDKEKNKRQYMPISKEEINQVFKKDELKVRLITKIKEFKPSVIFTLDNKIGGYGNPDHVFMSQLVLDICQEQTLGVQKIYQSVYSPSMEQRINIDWSAMWVWSREKPYLEALKVYNEPEGMPTPSCSIDIYDYASVKMGYLRSYQKKEQKTLGKFIPCFRYYPSWIYFWIFDKEYFHVIDLM